MENDGVKMGGKTCGCGCHQAIPALVILFGFDFLLGALGVITWGFVNIIWPILIIIAGCVKLAKRSCGCCAQHEGKM